MPDEQAHGRPGLERGTNETPVLTQHLCTSDSPQSARTGFTLVELTAVIILLSLIAGAATVVFREPYRLAKRQATIDRLIFIDQHVRRRAARHPGELVLDLKTRTATWESRADDEPDVQLASSLVIDRIWTLRSGEQRRKPTRIRFQTNGTAETYAVRTSVDNTGARWLLFIGLTGQHLEIGNDREANAVLRSLDTSGPDLN